MPLGLYAAAPRRGCQGRFMASALSTSTIWNRFRPLMEAARETNSPVIIQASRGARAYAQDLYLYHLMLAAAEPLSADSALHAPRSTANSYETCVSAIELGFTSVMMGRLCSSPTARPRPPSKRMLKVTRKVVDYAHPRGIAVEGEIGVSGGVEDGHGAGGTGLEHLTDPDQAVEFAERTGVDSLAVAIGNQPRRLQVHQEEPDGSVLKMDLVIAIHKRLPKTHLVMHGSSSVSSGPAGHRQPVRRQAEADLGRAVEEIQLGIKTASARSTWIPTAAWPSPAPSARFLWRLREKFDPRDYMKPARAAMQKVVAARMTQFGQAGHAGDYKASRLPTWPRATRNGTLSTKPEVSK